MNTPFINKLPVSKVLLVINILMAIVYLGWWFVPQHIGNPWLYGLLLFGEVYHVLMAIIFWSTIWPGNKQNHAMNQTLSTSINIPTVDIFITVAGEPVEIVELTVKAALAVEYNKKQIYILNDGFVAKKNNWRDMELLATKYGIRCITRKKSGGAKAGNINNALKHTQGEIVAIFDADMKPYSEFLKKVIPFFQQKTIGFVQTPQYYSNYTTNAITAGAWQQQEFFFGPIMYGKDQYNTSFICGTNFAIRRSTLLEVGGMREDNIAEDFLTSLFIHKKRWKSVYIPEVLSEGLAPEDLLSYYKQQLRWARGSLEILFRVNPLFMRGLTWAQKIQYLSSALFYFNGVIVLIDMLIPLIVLFSGIEPVLATATTFAIFFVPYMFLNLYTLYMVSNRSFTFKAISFTHASFIIHLRALKAVILNEKTSFSVTPKTAQAGNFAYLAYPHIAYVLLLILAVGMAVSQQGFTPSVVSNMVWGIFNIALFVPFILAAVRKQKRIESTFSAGEYINPSLKPQLSATL